MAITDIEGLSRYITLKEDEMAWKEDGENTLPLLISDHIAPLLSSDAIRRQFVPSSKENEDTVGTLDPQEEEENSHLGRLVHRYHNRAAFLVTDRCFAYCRHCFRRRFTGKLTGEASESEIRTAAGYIKEHAEIKEVLLTGGDIFTLSDQHIDRMLSIFKKECPSVIFRLCTRAVATNPARFTQPLYDVIRKNQAGAPFYLMTQFNHPLELTADAVEAVEGFIKLGIPAFNQTVLLKGVNDDEATLIELSEKLLLNRIKPYYLFQGDLVKGTRHLRVPLERGLEIEKNIRAELSGLGMPQYTIDLPEGGGKVILTHSYLIGKDNGTYIFSTPEGKIRHYPDAQ